MRCGPIARACVLVALACSCASDVKYVREGERLAAAHQYDKAVQQFMAALESNPNSPRAHLGLGMVYLETGRYDEAVKAIEQARRIEDGDEAMVAMAMVYYAQKRYADAAGMMEKVLQRSPERASNHYRLGLIRRQAGDLSRAAESFQMAITQDPTMTEARSQLGLTLKELKRYDEALEVLKDAVKDLRANDENVAEVQAALAEVYEAMQLYDYAVHSYKLAIKNNPKSGTALAGMGRTLRNQGHFDEAIELLQGAVKMIPNDPRLHLQLGLTYKDFRLEPQAIESLTRAVELNSHMTEAYAPLLELLDKTKITGESVLKTLQLAAAALPDDLNAQMHYGEAAYEAKKYDAAVQALKRALDLQPSNVEANALLGMAQVAMGNLDGARDTINTLKILDAAKADELAQAIEKASGKPEEKPSKAKPKKKKAKRKRR